MSRTANICQVVLSLRVGGTERLTETMLRRFTGRFASFCICLDELGELGEGLVADGFPIAVLGRRPGKDIRLAAHIAKLARRWRIDLFHCHHYSPWCYSILARFLAPRTRVVFTEHGGLDWPRAKPARRLFNRVMAPWTSGITAVSPAVRDVLVREEGFPAERIRLIYNGVDASALDHLPDRAQLRHELGLEQDAEYFILAASFRPVKAIEVLLAAMRRVVARRPSARLLLLGDGECREDIVRAVQENQLARHVVLPGFQSNVFRWLKAADAYVLPSRSEATSVSLIESMAAGIPAVASNVGGNPFVIDDQVTGTLVRPGDPDALADSMLDILAHPARRREYGCQARRRFEQHFELETMLDGYASLYEQALFGNGRVYTA